MLKERLRGDAFLARKLADEEKDFVADERRVYLLKCQLLLAQRSRDRECDDSDNRYGDNAWAPDQHDVHAAEQQLRTVLKLMENGRTPPKEVLAVACESLFQLGLKPTGERKKVVPRWQKVPSPAKDVNTTGELSLEVPPELATRWNSLVQHAPKLLKEDMRVAVREMQQLAAQWRFLVAVHAGG